MKKIVVFVLGPDRTGIIAAVSKTLFDQGCNLEDVSQTILQTEFVGIFIASMADEGDEDKVLSALSARIGPLGLSVHMRLVEEEPAAGGQTGEPFVITTVGVDRPGLMAGVTEVLASYGANITSLKAVSRGEESHHDYVMMFEADIPSAVNLSAFRAALCGRAEELGLDISLQHREIFEELNRV
ncbi:MAG: ACT domain-containing protein [Thermodesulfovibrionales bacterium]